MFCGRADGRTGGRETMRERGIDRRGKRVRDREKRSVVD
jgi:hypothetical protein